MWQKEFSQLLNSQIQKLKEKNPRYSLRAFGKKIGLSIGPLSNLLNGDKSWSLTSKRAAEILSKLDLKPHVRNRMLVRMGEPPIHPKETLPISDYSILTDWAYFPILFAFDLPSEHRVPGKIAKRLGLSEKKVRSVIDDLLARKLLIVSENGEIKRPEVFVTTSDGTPNSTIQMHHEVNLDLAKKALVKIPASKRDFTTLTFVGNEKQLSALKEAIRLLYEKASSLVDGDEENDQVYRLSIQLYPLEFKNS